ncbi:MAG: sugar phosphate nucleotidyltransferase [bacterium]
MSNNFKNTGIIILAAGKGKRLGCADIPKVLCGLNGKPIVSYILEELEVGGIDRKRICIVVGFSKEKVMETLGDEYFYALQEELLGTAHAAKTGEEKLPKEVDNFLVLNGDDSAFYTFDSLAEFIKKHIESKNDITLLTCEKEDPSGLGRIIRNEDGKVIAIREKENLLAGEDKIKEISTGTFCFRREWFNKIYPSLQPIKGLGEYGLPSFVEKAIGTGAKFEALKLENPNEWFGINTAEQLAEAEKKKRELEFEKFPPEPDQHLAEKIRN